MPPQNTRCMQISGREKKAAAAKLRGSGCLPEEGRSIQPRKDSQVHERIQHIRSEQRVEVVVAEVLRETVPARVPWSKLRAPGGRHCIASERSTSLPFWCTRLAEVRLSLAGPSVTAPTTRTETPPNPNARIPRSLGKPLCGCVRLLWLAPCLNQLASSRARCVVPGCTVSSCLLCCSVYSTASIFLYVQYRRCYVIGRLAGTCA